MIKATSHEGNEIHALKVRKKKCKLAIKSKREDKDEKT